MNLLTYLKQKIYLEEKYEPIELKNDLYYINNVKLNEIDEINKISNYKIMDITVISRQYHDVESDIRKINSYVLTKRGIIDLNKMKKNYFDKKQKGIVILKKLDSPKIEIIKEYNSFNDLDKDNLCLMLKEDRFICLYNKDLILDGGSINLEGILFATSFSKEKKPYDATMIIGMASNTNFNGSQLAYPIIGSLTNEEGLLYPYRDGTSSTNLSPGARTSWYNFFTKKYPLKPYAPIDDKYRPITDLEIDDDEVYNQIDKNLMDEWENKKDKINNFKGQRFYLTKYKKGDFTDWIYQVKDSTKRTIISLSKKLFKNHASFKSDKSNLESLILNHVNSFFRIMTEKRY